MSSSSRHEILERLLGLDLDALEAAHEAVINGLMRRCGGRVVIFGAGPLGRVIARRLADGGARARAFCDNAPGKQGTEVEGIPVISPGTAVQNYRDHLFVVTVVKNSAVCEQLRRLGLNWVLIPSFGRYFPDSVLPVLNTSIPDRTWQERDAVLRGLDIWSDDASTEEYFSQMVWRGSLDERILRPSEPPENIYFGEPTYVKREDECFVDCGAFDGDSVDAFLQRVDGRFGRILAIEPDPRNFAALQNRVRGYGQDVGGRIETYRNAVGAVDETVMFNDTGTIGASVATSGVAVSALRLDTLIKAELRPSLVKMDLEGAELAALKGAAEVVSRSRPVLCVCLYHQEQDLWEIPLYLKNRCPDYNLYLRRYSEGTYELVCYAVPRERLSVAAKETAA